jgi:hypothetical protein
MNQDLHFSHGHGLKWRPSSSYALLEVPSNLLLVRFGARRWIARIMLTWGLLSAAMMFVKLPMQFYVAVPPGCGGPVLPGRAVLLDALVPGRSGRAVSRFNALPLSSVVMGAVADRCRSSTACSAWRAGNGSSWWRAFLRSSERSHSLAPPNSPAEAPWLTDAGALD